MRSTLSTAVVLCALLIAGRPVFAQPLHAQAPAVEKAPLDLAGRPLLAQPLHAQAPAEKATLNLNAATLVQLATLPGIGPKVAERILEYRTKNGGFKKIEELMNVKGIGEKSFLKLKPLVSIARPDKVGGGRE